MALRTAIYFRHSTDKSKTENQRPEVEQIARARGYEVVATFEEQASAVKKRPEYERMMKAARRGGFDVLIVWAIDRFGHDALGLFHLSLLPRFPFRGAGCVRRSI